MVYKPEQDYLPLQLGIRRDLVQDITYREYPPPRSMGGVVYCFWVLYTQKPLKETFEYAILPDACIDIVFDGTKKSEPLIMTPHLRIETIDLGREFYYFGIRFYPGVFNSVVDVRDIVGAQNRLPAAIARSVSGAEPPPVDVDSRQLIAFLTQIVESLVDARIVIEDTLVKDSIQGFKNGLSVDAAARAAGQSTRQFRRVIFRSTGYTPVQLRRIVRFQQVVSSGEPLYRFADQSHLIKEFNRITGMSYQQFVSSFTDGRKIQS